ncbi:MAG: hypothetical protein ACLR8P_17385 [Clostridium fessum]
MGREAAVMDWEQKFPFLREKGHVVSMIGGGGKTTLLYALSAYCTSKGWRVLTATTTHIRKPVNVPWIAVNEGRKHRVENARKERDRLWQQGTYVGSRNPSPTRKIGNSARSDSRRVDFGCRYHISGGGWREMSSV